MGIILLEEAALQGIPAILIDPKGDLTNHLLHFPKLLPSDFAPWVDEDIARREGKTPDQAAAEAAENWQKGLVRSGIDQARMQKLADNVDYAIYSPGSDSGFPVSILSSLKAPSISWEENKEILRENISSTATALLELVGYQDIDPIRSREHILLSNIFENAWSQGHDLDLESLIMQVQNPPLKNWVSSRSPSSTLKKTALNWPWRLTISSPRLHLRIGCKGSRSTSAPSSTHLMANRATASFILLTWRTRNVCSSSPCSILRSRPGCAPNPAPAACARWFTSMKLSDTSPLLPIRLASQSSCACSSKRVPLALGWCLRLKTPLIWITKRFPTPAHGSSANSRPIRINSACWMAWRLRQAPLIADTSTPPFPPSTSAFSYCIMCMPKPLKFSRPAGR